MSTTHRIKLISATILLAAALSTPAFAQTGVFVNGRELSIGEVVQVQRCLRLVPGNYWMDAQGTFGYVGGGPIGNLVIACQQATAAASNGSSYTITPEGGASTVCGDGSSAYYSPNSSFIYTPDGGCMVDG